MALLFSAVYDGVSSYPDGYHGSSKKRSQHHEQLAIRHLDDGEEIYHDDHTALPLFQKQWRTAKAKKSTDGSEGIESGMMPSSVDNLEEVFFSDSKKANNHERYPAYQGIPRTLEKNETHKKKHIEKKRIHQQQLLQHRELIQHHQSEILMPSSGGSAANDNGDRGDDVYRPNGVVVRRGRLFRRNSKGGKRGSKGHKMTKSSKWSKSWNDCSWEDEPPLP